MIQKFKKNNAGFTLVELIVVIAILGVLMAVLVPQYIQYVERSRQAVDINYMGEVAHNIAIETATMESTTGVTFTITFDNATGAYTLANTGTTFTATDLGILNTNVHAIAANNAFKSKRFQTTALATKMTVTNGTIANLPVANNSNS